MKRKTNTDYTRDRRDRLLISGWCVDCAMNHNVAGHILCKHCLRARANREQRRRNGLKAVVSERDPPLTEKERTA